MSSLDGMKDIDIVPLLDNDPALIYETCGRDTLMRLWEGVPSMSLYISTKPINKAKAIFIQQNFDGNNAKELARFLGVSSRFVQDNLNKPVIVKQPTLFDDL